MSLKGDLWPFEASDVCEAGDAVTVIDVVNGIPVVRREPKEN